MPPVLGKETISSAGVRSCVSFLLSRTIETRKHSQVAFGNGGSFDSGGEALACAQDDAA